LEDWNFFPFLRFTGKNQINLPVKFISSGNWPGRQQGGKQVGVE
jgi:hypothetical protein